MKKTLCITLSLLFTLALSACGKADSPAPAVSGSNPSNTPVVSVPDAGSQQGQSPSSCTFDPALFGGKLQSCAYAGDPCATLKRRPLTGATSCPAWAMAA